MHYGEQRHAGLCLGRRRSQYTNLSSYDLHNAQAHILDAFYNMEYEITNNNNIRHETRWKLYV